MKPIVVIDAGHGGKDSGALGPKGQREKDVVLSVAHLLGAMIADIATVIFTRKDDTFIELGERARIANAAKATLFLSIHCNSGPPGQGDGYEVFTSPGQTKSDQFATNLFIPYANEFPDLRKRMDLGDGDEDKEEKFTVLTRTDMAAALFELEFIHTAAGAAFLTDPKNQARMAKALAAGIRLQLGVSSAAEVQPPAPVFRTFADMIAHLQPISARAQAVADDIDELIRKGWVR